MTQAEGCPRAVKLLYVPAAQSLHDPEISLSWYLPYVHAEQLALPAGERWPKPQGMQGFGVSGVAARPVLALALPAAHVLHVATPADEYSPGWHWVQSDNALPAWASS